MKPPYHLLEDGQATGPHSLVVLRQKADIRVITPESAVRPATSPDAPWLPIRAIADLHALLFPPKAAPVLSKAPAFTAANAAADSANRPVEVEGFLRQNTARLVVSEHFDPSRVPSRRARRHRGYVFTVACLAGLAWALYRFGPLPRTDMTVILLGSAVILAALLCYWIIYHVADFRS